MEVMTFVCKNAPFPAFEQTCWRSIEVVITSTTGNRVAVMSGTRVRIPPSPPKRKALCSAWCFFFLWDIHRGFERAASRRLWRIKRCCPGVIGGFAAGANPAFSATSEQSTLCSVFLLQRKTSACSVASALATARCRYQLFAARLKGKNSSFLADRPKKKSAMQCMALFLFMGYPPRIRTGSFAPQALRPCAGRIFAFSSSYG